MPQLDRLAPMARPARTLRGSRGGHACTAFGTRMRPGMIRRGRISSCCSTHWAMSRSRRRRRRTRICCLTRMRLRVEPSVGSRSIRKCGGARWQRCGCTAIRPRRDEIATFRAQLSSVDTPFTRRPKPRPGVRNCAEVPADAVQTRLADAGGSRPVVAGAIRRGCGVYSGGRGVAPRL